MELSDYLQLAKRNWKVLVALPLLLALGAFLNSNRSPKQYSSTATVLLKPNDPNERFGSATGSATETIQAARIVESLASVADGPVVAEAAATLLGDGSTASQIQSASNVSTSTSSNIMKIKTTTNSPERSAAIANAIAKSYIDNRRKSSVSGLDKAIKDLEKNVTDLKVNLVTLGGQPAGAARDTELTTTQDTFRDLSQKLQSLKIDRGLKQGEAEIVGDAKASKSPISPKPVRSAIAGLVAGLVLAAGVALLRDRLDLRLRSRDEAEELTKLPTLAEIPIDRRMSKDPFHIAALEYPDGLLAEAVRSLRVSMRFISLEQQLRVLLVTSATPGDGKSTVATNLAASYAVSGARTLLISADLRRPRVDDITNSKGASGLVEILTGIAEEEERRQQRARRASAPPRAGGRGKATESPVDNYPAPVRRRRPAATDDLDLGVSTSTSASSTGSAVEPAVPRQIEIGNYCYVDGQNNNLWVLPAGQPVANPVEILGSPVAKDFFAAARDQFDMVIVDSPPVLPVSDSLVMSSMVDGVLFVASLRMTNYKHVARGVERLQSAQANVIGLVLNRVPRDGDNAYYGRAPQDT